MDRDRSVIFKLRGKRLCELQPARVAQYVKLIAELVGSPDQVRFTKISEGSICAGLAVNPRHYPTFVERMTTAKTPSRASTTVAKTVHQLEEMITEDDMTAEVKAGRTKLLQLHGYSRETGSVIGPVIQPFNVRGQLIGLEGKDKTKHARIAEGGSSREVHGEIRDDSLAVALTAHLWRGAIEVSGVARLFRHPDGRWEIKHFRVEAFRPLDLDAPSAVMSQLREALGDASGAELLSKNVKTTRG
jgi:hypothetical protein